MEKGDKEEKMQEKRNSLNIENSDKKEIKVEI